MPIDLRNALPNSPEWWLSRLLRRLQARQVAMQRYDDYYNGNQPLAFASAKFREVFGERFGAFSSNFMALVVDGTRERLEVTGFRFNDPSGDKDLWQIWQDNDLDAGSQLAHTEALIKGIAYALVEPNGTETPLITVEDPLDCIVENSPKVRSRRIAALKRWIEPDGHLIAYVYQPDFIFKYRSTKPWDNTATWAVLEGMAPSMADETSLASAEFDRFTPDGESWPLANLLGVVPIIPLPVRPRLKKDGRSQIADVLSNQDAINKYRADALVAAEFAAFRQRWAIGIDIPIDPDTGQEIEPFKAAVDHLWAVPPDDPNNPNPTKVEFGEFEQTDLSGFKLMIDMEVDHIAHVTRMPLHELLGQSQSIPSSGEAIKSSETGMVAMCDTTKIFLGDGWEEVMRVCLRAMKDERADLRTAETLWKDSATRNEATITDAAVKLWQAGILDDQDEVLIFAGFSPEVIERLRVAREKRKAAGELPPVPGPTNVVPAPAGPRMGVGVPAGGMSNG